MDDLYVASRRVLLDALTALDRHRAAMILVGAQAVYLRVGEVDLAVAPHTTDGDLAIDPALLAEAPPLEQVLGEAGFLPKRRDSVGIWIMITPTSLGENTEIAVDLLVPASAKAPSAEHAAGRRSAHLHGHGVRVARSVRGLDGALVDADLLTLPALEPTDSRAFNIRVAGPGALLMAKLYKLDERQRTPRQTDKDALDVLRLLRGTPTDELAARMTLLSNDPRSSAACSEALEMLHSPFGSRSGSGSQMAIRATRGLADANEIAASCEHLAGDLLAKLRK